MRKKIGLFITHNVFAPFANSIPKNQYIISETLRSPEFGEYKDTDIYYELIQLFNSETSSIEERAKKMEFKIKKAIEEQNLDSVSIISHSISGLDSRYMINESSDLNRLMKCLITISTPNQGSLLADLIVGNKIERYNSERLNPLLGMNTESFIQSNSSNISHLNDYLDDKYDDRIFTFNGAREYKSHSNLFRLFTDRLIDEDKFESLETDGVLFGEEAILNKERHLGMFNFDHFQSSCFASDYENKKVYAMSLDFGIQKNF
jgi:hypothetical protein